MSLIIAHRGDPIRFRENTLPAFLAAESFGADMIELDVQLSKDGQCVILHDDTLNRLWNVDAAVCDLTYDEIRRATDEDAYQIPLLEDVLDAIHIPIMVDIKYENCIPPVADILKSTNKVEQVLFSGGNLEAHRLIRTHLPDAEAALTWESPVLPSDALFSELQPTYLNPPWWLLLPEFETFKTLGPATVKAMHSRGKKVSVWTVDELPLAEAWINLGVDAVISNRSREILEHVRIPHRGGVGR